MFNKEIPNEYRIRIDEVVNFILHNPAEELSLQHLAGIARYSPFHFQKIFKQVVGESPKQFVIRMRLETAAHALVMHQHKTVTEIAMEHGFSSSATFARSFKNYFGVSSEEFRAVPRRKNASRYQDKPLARSQDLTVTETRSQLESLNIRVLKRAAFRCVFVNARLNDDESIKNAFRKVGQIAETHDLISENSRFAGAIYLHSGIYRAMITTDPKLQFPERLNLLEIPAAKYALLDLPGGFRENMEQLQIFVDFWLPENGYRVADIVGYEMLNESPLVKSYNEIEKEVYIPIEPAV
jgi:AraC family transcriptional regulator